jgi:uncharacterized protein (TIGR02646 family)
MILIQRPHHSPIPRELQERVLVELKAWHARPPELRRQSTADRGLRRAIAQHVREPLSALFCDKCAYCESELKVSTEGEIDQFRPRAEATDLSGEGSPDHYGWLLAEWENLYLTCPACARAKRSIFPVDGPRADLFAPIEIVRATEKALLLDPCLDDPKDHMNFLSDGFVEPMSWQGETTIKVLNLNREGLVNARKRVWQRTLMRVSPFDDGTNRLEMLQAGEPHLAVVRAALASLGDMGLEPEPEQPKWRVVRAERRSAEEILAADEEAFRLTARTLRRVEIVNFRALKEICFDLQEPSGERAPWLMMLGENATGKSSILQAIALTLAGAQEARRLVRPRQILAQAAEAGSIRVWFWDQDKPAELLFRRGSDQFGGTQGPSAIVLGYGALRYAQRRGGLFDNSPRFSRVQPLLQTISRIRYPGEWLLGLDYRQFETAAGALQALLPASANAVLRRGPDRIFFEIEGRRTSLSELSAGYQTIVGISADIIRLLFERWENLASATAIVLIDELDAHLHPRWTMRIVRALREAFPQVQFIASTHDPLALRGLRNGEVALLRRDAAGAIVVDQNLPPIEGMQVDQLLTSRIFGLESTIDPETEDLLNEYYHLRSLPAGPGRDERIEVIKDEIGNLELLGRTESERLMLEAAEDFIRETADDPALREELRPETLRQLREIAERTNKPLERPA